MLLLPLLQLAEAKKPGLKMASMGQDWDTETNCGGDVERVKSDFYSFWTDNREGLQNEFQYDFRKGPREISAGTVLTVFTCIMAFNNRNLPYRPKFHEDLSKNHTEIRFAKPP